MSVKKNKIEKNFIVLKRAVKTQYGELHSDDIKEIRSRYIENNGQAQLSDDALLDLLYLIGSGNIKLMDLIYHKEIVVEKILDTR